MSRSQKRFTLIILGTFTTLLVLASLSGCETLQSQVEQPTVKLAGISLVEAGLIQQVYGVTLQVDNPNGFTLPIKGVTYAVKVGGQEFATGLTPERLFNPGKRFKPDPGGSSYQPARIRLAILAACCRVIQRNSITN